MITPEELAKWRSNPAGPTFLRMCDEYEALQKRLDAAEERGVMLEQEVSQARRERDQASEPRRASDVQSNIARWDADTAHASMVESLDRSLVAYLRRQWEWSRKTFGEGRRTAGILEHIRKELKEIEADPMDLTEWIDVVILGLDGFWRHGGQPERVMEVLQNKQDKNFARQWPEPGPDDQPVEHVRRSCNRHQDCDKAEADWRKRNPGKGGPPCSFHCHDDECEDCFGA